MYNQMLATIFSQLTQLASMSQFEDYIKSYQNSIRTQSILAISRGIVLVTPLSASCIEFLTRALKLLPSLFHQIALHDELELIIFKFLHDYSKVVLFINKV